MFQANLQSTSVHEYKYRIEDSYKRVQKLKAALIEWERKADDFASLADAVWSASDTVAEVKKRVTPRLSGVRDTGLRCRLILEVSLVTKSKLLVKNLKHKIIGK